MLFIDTIKTVMDSPCLFGSQVFREFKVRAPHGVHLNAYKHVVY